MFCHNKPLFRARSEGLGRLAHSVYPFLEDVHSPAKYIELRSFLSAIGR